MKKISNFCNINVYLDFNDSIKEPHVYTEFENKFECWLLSPINVSKQTFDGWTETIIKDWLEEYQSQLIERCKSKDNSWLFTDETRDGDFVKIAHFNNIDLFINPSGKDMDEPYCKIKFQKETAFVSIVHPEKFSNDIFEYAQIVVEEFIKYKQDEFLSAWNNCDYSWINED